MRQLRDDEQKVFQLVVDYTNDLGLLEITATGLAKSIMDATENVRTFLKTSGVHDYALQGQGPREKIVVSAFFILQDQLIKTEVSFYRPITKKGDPRIWFYRLKEYARPSDILALFAFKGELYLLNLTDFAVTGFMYAQTGPLIDILKEIKVNLSENADELLSKLRAIALSGPIPAAVDADTAVGRALERALGIAINSARIPDYKGIEIKSFRSIPSNRRNLFAQVPDWSISKYKSSKEILENFGYQRGLDYKLYCTVSTKSFNSQGLRLRLDELGTISIPNDVLIEFSENLQIGDFAIWRMEHLHKCLLAKHRETFWISANCIDINGIEHFIYKKVVHTRDPIISQFGTLINKGIITLDHLIKKDHSGRVVEKGPLFKITESGIKSLFPPSREHFL